jgi:hypothetical protein
MTSAPALAIGPPAAEILDGSVAGLAAGGGRDHLGLTEAAALEQNQPLALTRFRGWGWVDEATRSWGGDSPHLDESLLLLTRVEGARLAFSDTVSEQLAPRFAVGACPARLALDECAEGRSGGSTMLIGRVDRYVFAFEGEGVDPEAPAALQAERIRR